MSTTRTVRTGRISLTRVGLACLTFGISLPFCGIRKKQVTTTTTKP